MIFLHAPHESDTIRHVFFALWRSAVVAAAAAVCVIVVAGFSFIKPASANFAQPQKKQQQQRIKKRQYDFATVVSQSVLLLFLLLLFLLLLAVLPCVTQKSSTKCRCRKREAPLQWKGKHFEQNVQRKTGQGEFRLKYRKGKNNCVRKRGRISSSRDFSNFKFPIYNERRTATTTTTGRTGIVHNNPSVLPSICCYCCCCLYTTTGAATTSSSRGSSTAAAIYENIFLAAGLMTRRATSTDDQLTNPLSSPLFSSFSLQQQQQQKRLHSPCSPLAGLHQQEHWDDAHGCWGAFLLRWRCTCPAPTACRQSGTPRSALPGGFPPALPDCAPAKDAIAVGSKCRSWPKHSNASTELSGIQQPVFDWIHGVIHGWWVYGAVGNGILCRHATSAAANSQRPQLTDQWTN